MKEEAGEREWHFMCLSYLGIHTHKEYILRKLTSSILSMMVHHILNHQPNARLGGVDPIFFKCLLRKRTFFKQVSFCTLKIHKHCEHKHI